MSDWIRSAVYLSAGIPWLGWCVGSDNCPRAKRAAISFSCINPHQRRDVKLFGYSWLMA